MMRKHVIDKRKFRKLQRHSTQQIMNMRPQHTNLLKAGEYRKYDDEETRHRSKKVPKAPRTLKTTNQEHATSAYRRQVACAINILHKPAIVTVVKAFLLSPYAWEFQS